VNKPIFTAPIFHHLWFLWFLCWLVAGFVLVCAVLSRLPLRSLPQWSVLSVGRFVWIVPLTIIPQWFMGFVLPTFGPDTSTGLLPMPHVLFYYAVFFGFGAVYFDADDVAGRVGRWWGPMFLLSVCVLLPIGLEFATGALGFRERIVPATWFRAVFVCMQVLYAWLMTFACIGFFRTFVRGERFSVRYMSDASYWLYVAHVPLVVCVQLWIAQWRLPVMVKFVFACATVVAVLLVIYQTLVRYTWLGTLLNGPRTRRVYNVSSS